MRINDFNREYIKSILKNQRFFLMDNVPWQWFNYESGKWFKNSNLHTRCDFLFTKTGFFAETLKELDEHYIENERKKYQDFAYRHRQTRYIAQEFIDTNGVFNNPIHLSAKPLDGKRRIEPRKGYFESVEYIRKVKDLNALELSDFEKPPLTWIIICHPGYTRFRTSCFLQQNIKKAILTINNETYKEEMCENLKELKTPDDFLGLWKPHDKFIAYNEDKWATFSFNNLRGDSDLVNGTKWHKQTECNVLKLWRLSEKDISGPLGSVQYRDTTKRDYNHTRVYYDEFFESSKDIAKIMFEKTLTIYTNSKLDVKEILDENRVKLLYYAEFMHEIQKGKKDYNSNLLVSEMDLIHKFKFEVVFVEDKPVDIAQYNKNKGFAIWIDKDMVENINREIYELLYYTRWDIKSAATRDGKVEVVNCRTKFDTKWVIEDSFFEIEQEYDRERYWL